MMGIVTLLYELRYITYLQNANVIDGTSFTAFRILPFLCSYLRPFEGDPYFSQIIGNVIPFS
jgi:hypothetical protein